MSDEFPKVTIEPRETPGWPVRAGDLVGHVGVLMVPADYQEQAKHLPEHHAHCACSETYHVPCHSLACKSGDKQVVL